MSSSTVAMGFGLLYDHKNKTRANLLFHCYKMNTNQEPKYGIVNGRLYNRQSGEFIPDDEPIFILRARDKYAANLLAHYKSMVTNSQHYEAVSLRLVQFDNWALNNPKRMKEPDTILTANWKDLK